ncbi:MAG: enoyl-CoA hydratase/isomerase [Alphaproteobacteria bacterium]|nr:enoyl-CoA hydratase/isomerase [Alphaproteobacteria bacterium]
MARIDFEKAFIETHGPVAVLTMNDPATLNAAALEMVTGLSKACDWIAKKSNGVRAVILTGAGRGFCSGANLQGGASSDILDPAERDTGAALETHYHPFLRKLQGLPCPLVTAVNGPAAGVGMSFALMGDLIVAARSAYFLQAFRRIGLVPDGGSTWMLPRLIGSARARELSLLGEKLPAEKALEWGLINRVTDDSDLMDEAMKLASELANGPTVALSMIRQLYWQSLENSFEQQINAERWAQQKAGRSADFTEGVMAFLQKRPAKFTGE